MLRVWLESDKHKFQSHWFDSTILWIYGSESHDLRNLGDTDAQLFRPSRRVRAILGIGLDLYVVSRWRRSPPRRLDKTDCINHVIATRILMPMEHARHCLLYFRGANILNGIKLTDWLAADAWLVPFLSKTKNIYIWTMSDISIGLDKCRCNTLRALDVTYWCLK